MTTIDATWHAIPLRPANRDTLVATAHAAWDSRHPHEFVLSIAAPGQPPIPWALSRDVLAEGLDRPVGENLGDYMVLPDLTQPDGHAIELVLAVAGRGVGASCAVVLPVADVRDFLDATFDEVGADVVVGDWDGEWRELAGGAA